MNSNEAVTALVEAFDRAGIPYMIVGSFSSNAYGVVRSTKDADFVVPCPFADISRVVKELGPPWRFHPQIAFESVTGTKRCLLELDDDPFHIEVFRLSDDPHDQQRFGRRHQILLPNLQRPAIVPTPEDVIVTKLRWVEQAARSKDRDDVRDIITVQQELLDWDYIHHWCGQHGTRQILDDIRSRIPPLDP